MLRKVQSHFANYFNEDKLFDVSIIKGAELGTLYSDYEGYEADEFYLIPQENLFFIADTNVTIDEILIKASTEILDAQWGGNNANYQKKSNRKGKDIIQPIGGATGGETLYGIGKISGGGGNCEDYACEGAINPLELKTKRVQVYDVCSKPKQRGAFVPVWSSLNSPYVIKVCFNRDDETWNYGVENDEILYSAGS